MVDGHPVAATLSIGIALIRQSAEAASLLGDADKALYRAKDCGRNRVEVADEQPAAKTPVQSRVADLIASKGKRSAA